MNLSEFKFYSIGTVAANKPLNSHEIEVLPIEANPMVDGELTDQGVMYGKAGTTSEGEAYHVEVPTSPSIKASWLPLANGNRLTSPNVRRGERVVIYRFGNADAFYWQEIPEDGIALRKLETIVWGISATRKENAVPSEKNTYFIELSSHNKVIHIHTSMDDGEPFAYDIQLNTKDGNFQINDNAGQIISLDSKEREIELINADKSTVLIKKRTMRLFAMDSIDIETKALSIKAETFDTKATTNTITAKTTHNGPFMLNGPLTQKGGGTGGGAGASFGNDVSITGAVVMSSTLRAGIVNVTKLISAQNIDAPNV